MIQTPNRRKFKLLPAQDGFIFSQAWFPCLICGWGYGKSLALILKALRASTEFEDNLGLIVRKEFTDLRDSTMRDFTALTGLKIGESKNVQIPTKGKPSTIMFRHASELDVLQNVNLGWALIEQADEFETDAQFQMLRGRPRREGCEHFLGLICNANGRNWIHKYWVDKDLPRPTEIQVQELERETHFTRAQIDKAFDPAMYEVYMANSFNNPYLPEDMRLQIMTMKTQAPNQYRRLVMNSFDDMDVADRVIPYEAVRKAIKRQLTPLRHKKVVSCDPSEFGDDETVIYAIDTGRIVERDVYSGKEPMETAGRIIAMARRHQTRTLVIDPIGIGSGIRSRLSELGWSVISADSRERASDPKTDYNRRAEFWFSIRQRFIDGSVSLPDDDPRLVEELTEMRWKYTSSGLRRVEGKDEIRKAERLGRSPGRADALIYGLWAEPMAPWEDDFTGLDECIDEKSDAERYAMPAGMRM